MTLHQSIHSETQALSIAPLTSRVGAEIRDLRLSADLPEPVVDALWSALLTHKVLFFRGQSHLGGALAIWRHIRRKQWFRAVLRSWSWTAAGVAGGPTSGIPM